MAEGGPVDLSSVSTPDVPQNEADGSADGGVGPGAAPEHVVAGVESQLLNNRPADDCQRADAIGCGLNAVEVELVM